MLAAEDTGGCSLNFEYALPYSSSLSSDRLRLAPGAPFAEALPCWYVSSVRTMKVENRGGCGRPESEEDDSAPASAWSTLSCCVLGGVGGKVLLYTRGWIGGGVCGRSWCWC